jgi:hypothetical protein
MITLHGYTRRIFFPLIYAKILSLKEPVLNHVEQVILNVK